jgi:hypothetical protein
VGLNIDPIFLAIPMRNSTMTTKSRIARGKLPIKGQTAFHFRRMPAIQALGKKCSIMMLRHGGKIKGKVQRLKAKTH